MNDFFDIESRLETYHEQGRLTSVCIPIEPTKNDFEIGERQSTVKVQTEAIFFQTHHGVLTSPGRQQSSLFDITSYHPNKKMMCKN
jgi:hypothetical protein